ncbi:MAG: hypothetical protein NTX44_10495, partial [Ignavibacteriales bacterium]|nr:hypothetical protein [Ignavibacteriales bacterium]
YNSIQISRMQGIMISEYWNRRRVWMREIRVIRREKSQPHTIAELIWVLMVERNIHRIYQLT